MLDIRGLTIRLPGGTPVVERATLSIAAGEVVSLLGPSGAGKTTLLRAAFTPDELRSGGWDVTWDARVVPGTPAFVPQRGALLDHLDVAENITLAQAGAGLSPDAETWLTAVDLDPVVAKPGRAVSTLSGGQAQRVAVARALAAGRKLIVLDEPSVGLDPLGVRLLARLLVTQARRHGAAIVIITHDLALAGGASDRVLFLDPAARALVPVLASWSGPVELDPPNQRQARLAHLDSAVEDLLLAERPRAADGGGKRAAANSHSAFGTAAESLVRFFDPRLALESGVVLRRALLQGLLRPLAFYATVGVLLGVTVPYVIVNITTDLRPGVLLEIIGGSYILSLAPPLSAIVFAATSGSAINAWLGGLRLNGQVMALEGLAVPPARYLWAPAWWALVVAYLTTVVVFIASMVLGGFALFSHYGVVHALDKLTADFLAPIPARLPYLVRGIFLVFAYALALASIVVAKGASPKSRSDDVTAAMTSSVMRSTLFVVVVELATVVALFASTGPRR